jgi:hypothetical protein
VAQNDSFENARELPRSQPLAITTRDSGTMIAIWWKPSAECCSGQVRLRGSRICYAGALGIACLRPGRQRNEAILIRWAEACLGGALKGCWRLYVDIHVDGRSNNKPQRPQVILNIGRGERI